MGLGTILNVGQTVVLFVSLLVAYAGFRNERRAAEAELAENFYELVMPEYVDRKLVKPIYLGGKKCDTLKKARDAYRNQLRQRDAGRQLLPKFDDARLREFHEKSQVDNKPLRPQSNENVFAYSLSLGLNRLGGLTMVGCVHKEMVLALWGPQLVEDWIYCSALVNRLLRDTEFWKLHSRNKDRVAFGRRHAEWLAIESALWLEGRWEGDVLKEALAWMAAIAKNPDNPNIASWRQRSQPEIVRVLRNRGKGLCRADRGLLRGRQEARRSRPLAFPTRRT